MVIVLKADPQGRLTICEDAELDTIPDELFIEGSLFLEALEEGYPVKSGNTIYGIMLQEVAEEVVAKYRLDH